MRSLLLASVFASAFAASVALSDDDPWPRTDFKRYEPIKQGITWKSCDQDFPAECGTFEVPMDYKNASAGKAALAVIRFKARKQPRLGTLFTNPGGPGLPGATISLAFGVEDMMKASGGQYDIISWDPRGSFGGTVPHTNCFANKNDERNIIGNSSYLLDGIEIHANVPSMKDDLANFRDQAPVVDSQLVKLGSQCLKYSPDVMQYVGTMATVRDMLGLHEYLGGANKPLNYWGISYGTIIGVYFANTFPKRVGRFVLDAVVDPDRWANRPPHESWKYSISTATNVSLAGFASECIKAGQSRCAFTAKDDSDAKLHQRIIGLINRAYSWKKANESSLLGSGSLRQYMHRKMYSPEQWPDLAKGLAQYDKKLPRDSTGAASETMLPQQPNTTIPNSIDRRFEADFKSVDYGQQAITCGDAINGASNIKTKDVLDEISRVTEKDPIFGPLWSTVLYCHRWPVRAVERYTGPWNKNPANKILFIGTDGDPITPFIWAEGVAKSYGNNHAALVQQKGYGHPSTAMRSDCTLAIISNYLVNNALPPTFATVCQTNQNLFPEQYNPEDNQKGSTKHQQWFSVLAALGCSLLFAVLYLAISHMRGRKGEARTPNAYSDSQKNEKTDAEMEMGQTPDHSDPLFRDTKV